MGRLALQPSTAIAQLFREERKRRGWTLRDVENRTRSLGRPIPFATLAKVEQGRVDPGVRRFHTLLRVYDLPLALAQEALDLEEFAGELAVDGSTASLKEDAVQSWKSGDLRRGFALFSTLQQRASQDPKNVLEQQKALLSLAMAVGSLGRFRLLRHIIEELLLAPPLPELMVPVLLQAAICWHWLGSGEVALGFLSRAEVHADPSDHRHAAWIAHERASTLASMGQLDEADRALAQAVAEYRADKNPFGESQALGVRVRLCFERGDTEGARRVAREARLHAEEHGFERLVALRSLDEGRAIFDLGNHTAGLGMLHDGLARAVANQDQVAQFYAHYFLWKAHARQGEIARAEMELEVARYFVRFLDAAVPEAVEIRELGAERRARAL